MDARVARERIGRRRIRLPSDKTALMRVGGCGCGFERGAIRSFLARWRVPVALTGDLFVGEEELMVLRAESVDLPGV